MKCTYKKDCEVKKGDKCGASILGYCGFQEKEEAEKPVEKNETNTVRCIEDDRC